jgi:plastocyanin
VLLLAAGLSQAAPLTVTVQDGAGRPLVDAVVSVEVKGVKPAAGAKADIVQKDRRFVPDLLVVGTGTAVSFPNEDTVRHHVYSFSPIKPFEIKLYVGTPTAPVVFDKPGVAVLGCNIHDTMVARVVVVDTPYVARTDASGKAVLELPAGEHLLKLWHAGLPETSPPMTQTLRMAAAPQALTLRAAPR